MAAIRFLCDEQVPEQLVDALVRAEPAIEAHCVGEPATPKKGSTDPDLIGAAETAGWMILTLDKNTMPGHVASHLAAGRHTCGVILLRRGLPIRRYVDDLVLMWSSSQAEEWRDVIDWLPW